MKEFEGKYCIVTGAARGMGRQVAEKLAAQGAKLALMDINADLLDKTASEIAEAFDTQVISVPCDLSKKAEIDRAMALVTKEFPHINVLAFCAGIVTSRLIIDIPEEEWDRVMNVNLKLTKKIVIRCRRINRTLIGMQYDWFFDLFFFYFVSYIEQMFLCFYVLML